MRWRSSDVISIAASRYIPTMPHATASRVPRTGERHEHVGDAEVGVGVEQDRADVHADEHDRQARRGSGAGSAATRGRPTAEHLGREQQPPHDGGEDERPRDDAARPGDVPRDRVHAQLPLVVVCAVTDCERVLEVVDVADAVEVLLARRRRGASVLAAAVCVVAALKPSRQASAPPSESMVATLSAVAALRARAGRGLRRGRPGGVGTGAGLSVCSSMTTKVRTRGERSARGG